MNENVKITMTKSGIVLKLDKDLAWEDLKKEVEETFRASSQFWGDARKAIAFRERELSEAQQEELLEVIGRSCDLQIVGVLDEDPAHEAAFEKALTDADAHTKLAASRVQQKAPLMETDNGTGFFFKGNLRSGQVLDVETSIIILGDVNAGAKVVSKGNVIILGSLKGNVFAGSAGNVDAFVIALDMKPMQIRIADTIARSPDDSPRRTKQRETKIAFWEDGNIYIEPLDKEVMGDIRLS